MSPADTAELARALRARPRRSVALDGHRQAAVAVLLRPNSGAIHIPFTRRADHLRKHSGQISFPGGAIDAGETPQQAAIRETNEELGVIPTNIEPLGLLDDVPTPTGFVITPVVATLSESARLVPAPAEVAEVFEVPATFFANPDSRTVMGTREFRGKPYELLAYDYEEWRIWGATARIVDMLMDVWRESP